MQLALFVGYGTAQGVIILNNVVCPPQQDTQLNQTISNATIPFDNINQFGIAGNIGSSNHVVSSMNIVSPRGNMSCIQVFSGLFTNYMFVNYNNGAYIILSDGMTITFSNYGTYPALEFDY